MRSRTPLLFLHSFLLQAQECILEKSMLDQRKGTIIAKVAAQIVDYYDNQLTKGLETEVVAKTLGSKKVCVQSVVSLACFYQNAVKRLV